MRAGFGKYDLTPPLGVELTGYGYYLNRRALSVRDPLYARALFLDCGNSRSLIISCELLGLNRHICADVASHAAKYGIRFRDLIIVSVHTHTGPSVKYHEGCGYVDESYEAGVAWRINQAVDAAYADLAEVEGISHMCEPLPGDYIYNRADPDGPVDRTVRGFAIQRVNASPIAAVSTACHCVFRGRDTAVSADLAGEVNRFMQEKGYASLFLNGLCGDIDPWKPTHERLTECARLITDVFFTGHQELPLTLETGVIPYTLRLTPVTREDIISAANTAVEQAGGSEEPAARVALIWKDEMLEKLDRLSPEESICVKMIILGGVPVIALPFEGFTRIGMDIRRIIGRHDALTLGCAEELLGYLPTKDDIKRGAYAALESTFLYKRLPVVPGEAERIGEEMGNALKTIMEK
ncbi:MAG: hypothetical protein IKK75_00335 [Clostridia bacterium]|nr:hypothetical protein [Clostridia bacterium]